MRLEGHSLLYLALGNDSDKEVMWALKQKLACAQTEFMAKTENKPRGRAIPPAAQIWPQNNTFLVPPSLKKKLKFPATSSSLFF